MLVPAALAKQPKAVRAARALQKPEGMAKTPAKAVMVVKPMKQEKPAAMVGRAVQVGPVGKGERARTVRINPPTHWICLLVVAVAVVAAAVAAAKEPAAVAAAVVAAAVRSS